MSDLETETRAVLDAYVAAVRAKDVAALMALYAPEARVFDAWAVWSYEGAAAWEGAVRGWLGALGDETVAVRWEEPRIVGAGDVAAVSAIVRYAAVASSGDEPRAMHNRLTWVLIRCAGALRIVHEHTSAPLGPDDMKGILERHPM